MNAEPLRSPSIAEASALEARFGLRVAACLNRQSAALPHDLTERLRVAREHALARARGRIAAREATGAQVVGNGKAARSQPDTESWWWRLSSLAPLLVLVIGLFVVHETHVSEEITAVADVDAALLTDAVPLAAYSDPGFAEFLREPVSSAQN